MTTEVALDATPTTLACSASAPGPGHDGPGVTLVHGFAQNRRCLGPLADALASDHALTRVDAPGHGGSSSHGGADLWAGADLLTSTVGPGVYAGYSMGARLCLHAAIASPHLVRALVLIGGTAGIDDEAERADRRASDAALADRLELIGLDAFVAEWLALPMFSGLPDWARFDDERRTNSAAGLADSLRHAGTGAMAPVWDRLDTIRCPVLCVTGALDERYGALAARITDRVGGSAQHVVVPGAGHAAHLERPEATSAAVLEFLSSLD